jgi:tetrapyrrole methylase family protein / MazG family protein
MRVWVVGLGPGPADWITPAARARLRAPGAHVFARTALFPALPDLLHDIAWTAFDDVYQSASTLEEVHVSIASRLLAAGDDVVLAVPGDGVLGEAILTRLLSAGAAVDVVPGVPLGAGALAASGLSASDGAQLVEATSLGGSGIDLLIELNPRWPAVVTGIYSPRIASDLKLALQRVYPPDHAVVLVHHPALHDAQTLKLSLADLDRLNVELDHLTHLVVPPVVGYIPNGSSHGLRAIVARLRAPEIGCPWDLEQTHRSLIPYAIEEAYEVVDAIESDDIPGLADELGDLLLQVALHAEIADQHDEFEWNDVVRTLSEKLVRRHPHVFGDAVARDAHEVRGRWEALKREQEGREGIFHDVPGVLPALLHARKLQRRASAVGFDWADVEEAWPALPGEVAELREALDAHGGAAEGEPHPAVRHEAGDVLFAAVNVLRLAGVDPELALRDASGRFRSRVVAAEALAAAAGEDFRALGLDAQEGYYRAAKARVPPTAPPPRR